MKLIIIGNGFDLNHGLKTRFSDFKKYSEKLGSEEQFISDVDELFKKTNNDPNGEYDWNQIEKIIYEYFRILKKEGKDTSELEDLLDDFSEKFDNYLNNELNNCIGSVKLNPKLKKIFDSVEPLIILDFNFTNLIEKYTMNQDFKLNIHGIISSKGTESINIGYYIKDYHPNGFEKDYKLGYNGNVVCKRCNSFKHSGINLDKKINDFVLKNNLQKKVTEIISMGYSFGESDSHIFDILTSLFAATTDRDNLPKSDVPKPIPVKIFDFNGESDEIYKRFISGISKKIKTNVSATGTGYKRDVIDLFPKQTEKYNDN